MANTEQRLTELLDLREQELQELSAKLAKYEDEADVSELRWMAHELTTEPVWLRHLPLPRLEMRFTQPEPGGFWYQATWVYGLVYRHFSELEGDKVLFIPFSRTKVSGGGYEQQLDAGVIPMPYRDSAHIKSEVKLLNLPAYLVCPERQLVEAIEVDDRLDAYIEQMRRAAA
jgi:hypothetical protein